MATIVTRSGKGSPLTNTEVDANFTNLNTDKAELSGATFTGEIVAPSLDISGNIDVDGTTNLDVVDIDGAVDMASTLQVDGSITSSDEMTITKAVDDQLTLAYNASNSTSYGYFSIVNNNLGNEFSIHTGGGKTLKLDANKDITFYAANGTTPSFVYDESLGLTINESGADRDFRVESDGQAHMLFVDGGNDAVGIGLSGPTEPLTILAKEIGGGGGAIGLWNYNSSQKYNIQTGISGVNNTDFVIRDDTNSADRFRIASDGAATFTGAVTANAGISVDNITIDGNEIDVGSGDLTLDVAGDIILDADGGVVYLNDGGVGFGQLVKNSNDFRIFNPISDGDIVFRGNDAGSVITALSLDMSAAGAATFNAGATFGSHTRVNGDFSVSAASGEDRFAILPQSAGSGTIVFSGNAGLTAYEPLIVLDSSAQVLM